MHPGPAIRPASSATIKMVANVLTDAFATDPVMSWILPPTLRQRRERMRRLWMQTAREYIQRDQAIYLTDDGMGATIWAKPGASAPTLGQEIARLVPYLLILRGSTIRASRFTTEVLTRHPKSPPHWYLYAIGAHTSSQGRGVGSALLRDRLEELDLTGEPAYLESSNIRNVPLYERHGFEVVEEITVPRGGPTLWRMWREPGA